MHARIADLISRIRSLEQELEAELRADLAQRAERFRYRLEQGRIRFDEAVAREHRLVRPPLWPYVIGASLRTILTAPIMYAMIVPLVLLDLATSVFQAICFPLYGIARVQRGGYVVFDRHRLGYLNAVEKINCEYCAYANGIVAYAREVASRTEQYWCPIKHARRRAGAHGRYGGFVDFGDVEAYRQELQDLREKLRSIEES